MLRTAFAQCNIANPSALEIIKSISLNGYFGTHRIAITITPQSPCLKVIFLVTHSRVISNKNHQKTNA